MRQKCLPIMVLSHLNSPLLLRCHQNSGTMYMITDRGDFDRLRSSFQAANLSNAISFLADVTDYIPVKKLKGRSPVPWINGPISILITKETHIISIKLIKGLV